jgi:hypothetical protein
MDQTGKPEGSEGGNKIFLFFILAMCILIVILLLLLMTSVVPVGSVVCKTAAGKTILTGGGTTGGGPSTTNITQTGGQTQCPPQSGNVDGAQCECTENDCTDGVDNDNDGQTDCDDPDCNCGENCPECPPCAECGTYPNCKGECRTTSGKVGKCLTDREKQQCYCGETQLSCEDTLEYKCNGDCPTGESCKYLQNTDQTARCDCVPDRVTCEESFQYQCTGTCPDDQVCEPYRTQTPTGAVIVMQDTQPNACRCVPKQTLDCADSIQQQCTGTCPNGLECEMYQMNLASTGVPQYSCRCAQQPCESTSAPACGGSCPTPSQKCSKDSKTGKCVCSSIDCGQIKDANACTPGVCPVGKKCTPTTWNTCQCTSIKCGDADTPDCKGTCPSGQTCNYVDEDTCACEPESQDCEDINGDTENECKSGECPNDEEDCLPTDRSCSCEIRCENVESMRDCPDGWCPDDEVCAPYYYDHLVSDNPGDGGNIVNPMIVAAPNPCSCRPKCADIDAGPNDYWLCNEGYCDSGYCTYDRGKNVCGCVTYPPYD